MLIKKESEYAVLGLVSLAGLGRGFYDIKIIAKKAGLPRAHLAKIFQKLAKSGLVESKLGPDGGFRLKQDSGQITLESIIGSIQPKNILKCGNGRAEYCPRPRCQVREIIREIERRLNSYLGKINLNQLS